MQLRQWFLTVCLIGITLPTLAESNQDKQQEPKSEPPYSELSIYDKPLMERYVLDELKTLRANQQDLERRMIIEITDRELAVADKSLNYANVTVTYFFYIIAGVASLIALIGWQSLREMRVNTKKMADQQLQEIAEQYEKKFQALERELRRKTRSISDNNKEN